jgi:hypothetical protein
MLQTDRGKHITCTDLDGHAPVFLHKHGNISDGKHATGCNRNLQLLLFGAMKGQIEVEIL